MPVWTFFAPLALMILICSTTAFGIERKILGLLLLGSRGGSFLEPFLPSELWLGGRCGRRGGSSGRRLGSGGSRGCVGGGSGRFRSSSGGGLRRGRGGGSGLLRLFRQPSVSSVQPYRLFSEFTSLGVLGADDADGLARALAGAGVGLGALAADGKTAAMADATVAIDRLEALQIALDIPAEIALDQQAAAGDRVDDGVELLDAQILGARHRD